jgi:hypothetical protein
VRDAFLGPMDEADKRRAIWSYIWFAIIEALSILCD